ncbi:hypothetical protein V8C26DRAFT_408243 [Trichoderma gracile]
MTKRPSPLEVHIYRALPTLTIAYLLQLARHTPKRLPKLAPLLNAAPRRAPGISLQSLRIALLEPFTSNQCLLQALLLFLPSSLPSC